MKLMYTNPITGEYDLMAQLQAMADARALNPDRKPPKMYYNYAQQKCYEEAAIVPSLRVILGWTPMREWIGKCKAYVPTPKSFFDVNHSNQYMFLGSHDFFEELERQIQEYYRRINSVLSIPRGKDGSGT